MLKTFQSVKLSSIPCFSAIGEKARKSMLKRFPKWVKNHPKIDAEVAWCHLFFDFIRFGEFQKKHAFSMPLRWLKNPENRTRNCSKDVFPAQLDGQPVVEGIVLGAWVPGAATRAR